MLAALGVVLFLVLLSSVVVCIQKGKAKLSLFALFIFGGPVVVVIGAIRLAKPDSVWAKEKYDEAMIGPRARTLRSGRSA